MPPTAGGNRIASPSRKALGVLRARFPVEVPATRQGCAADVRPFMSLAFASFEPPVSDPSVADLRPDARVLGLGNLLKQSLMEVYISSVQTGRFLEVSLGACRNLGYSTQQLLTMTAEDVLAENWAEGRAGSLRELFQRLPISGEAVVVETEHRRSDGSVYPISLHLQRSNFLGEPVCLAFGVDLSERRRLEALMENDRRLLTSVIDSIPYSVFWKDRASRYLGCNRAFADKAHLYDPNEVLGLTDFDFSIPEEEAARYCQIDQQVMKSGKSLLCYEELHSTSEGEVLNLETSKVPLLNDRGEVVGVLGMFQDITKRKQMELGIAQAHRFESIGQLAAGLAHEINTPLQFLASNVEYLQDETPQLWLAVLELRSLLRTVADSGVDASLQGAVASALADTADLGSTNPLEAAISDCCEGVRRVMAIVRAMKEFSHPEREAMVEVDINRTIRSAATITRHQWKYSSEMVLDLEPGELPHPCHPSALNQVLVNLIVNAADAVAETVDARRGDTGTIVVRSRREPRGVRIEVEDSGPGIPADVACKVFDLFFTTKGVGQGTGQGLAICRNVVVNQHQGEITFRCPPTGGTIFSVFLPVPERSGAISTNTIETLQ